MPPLPTMKKNWLPSLLGLPESDFQRMLTLTLKGLERDGLVRRTVYPEVPVRVEYTLTEAGRTLREPLRALEEWSIAHLSDVSVSQEAYDDAHRPTPDSADPDK